MTEIKNVQGAKVITNLSDEKTFAEAVLVADTKDRFKELREEFVMTSDVFGNVSEEMEAVHVYFKSLAGMLESNGMTSSNEELAATLAERASNTAITATTKATDLYLSIDHTIGLISEMMDLCRSELTAISELKAQIQVLSTEN